MHIGHAYKRVPAASASSRWRSGLRALTMRVRGSMACSTVARSLLSLPMTLDCASLNALVRTAFCTVDDTRLPCAPNASSGSSSTRRPVLKWLSSFCRCAAGPVQWEGVRGLWRNVHASRRHNLGPPQKGRRWVAGLEAAQRHTEGCDSGGAAAYLHVVVARLQCTTAVQSTSGCVRASCRSA